MKKHHDGALITALALLTLLIPEDGMALIPLCILAALLLSSF